MDHFFYPSIQRLPSQTNINDSREKGIPRQEGVPSEFDQVMDQITGEPKSLDFIRQPLKFTPSASQKLRDQKIVIDSSTLAKVGDAMNQAEAKGVVDALVITKDAAMIVNVQNRMITSAFDKNQLSGQVMSQIDGAIFI